MKTINHDEEDDRQWLRVTDPGVEVAFDEDQVLIRNAKFGSILAFSYGDWESFIEGAKDGVFDIPKSTPAPTPSITITDPGQYQITYSTTSWWPSNR